MDGQGLLVVADGPPHIAQLVVGVPQVAQAVALAAAVADLAADGQGLLVVADGPPRIAQSDVGATQVAQAGCLSRRSPSTCPAWQSALEVAQSGIGIADVQVGHTYHACRPTGLHALGPIQRAGRLGPVHGRPR